MTVGRPRLSGWKSLTPKKSSSTSSSFYWVSAANAPNVLQPYWLIVLPLDVPDLTASLLWGPSGQRWRCLWTFLFSNVPTFATSRLWEILAAKGGTTWARNGLRILPGNTRLPRNIQGSFTCRKYTVWDRRLYFPSEGRRADDFFPLKNPTASVGFEPSNLGTKGHHATSRPWNSLRHITPDDYIYIWNISINRLELSAYFLYHQVQCSKLYVLSEESIFVFYMDLRTNNNFSLYSIKLLHIMTEIECVYLAVQTEVLNTGCFTTLGHNCRRWFPRSLWSKKFI